MVTLHELKNVKKVEPYNIEGHVQGTTANAYANALDLDVRGMRQKTIILVETGASNGLTYKVLGSAFYSGGQEDNVVEETALSASGKALIKLSQAYARLKLQVKSTVEGSHATYTAEYTMEGI